MKTSPLILNRSLSGLGRVSNTIYYYGYFAELALNGLNPTARGIAPRISRGQSSTEGAQSIIEGQRPLIQKSPSQNKIGLKLQSSEHRLGAYKLRVKPRSPLSPELPIPPAKANGK